MDCKELLEIVELGEDSHHQFKANFKSIDQLAVEIAAFANSDGGRILVGVSDDGELTGLSKDDIKRLNQWISNATTNKIDKQIFVRTEIVTCDGKRTLTIHVPRGLSKPYSVNRVEVWVKSGADKRRAPIEEILRLAQTSGLVFADELETEATLLDFDERFFKDIYHAFYQEELNQSVISLEQLLKNIKLIKNDRLTLAGLLLCGKKPERIKPQFTIKGTHFDGLDISEQKFKDKEDIEGKLINQYHKGVSFVKRNLHRIQLHKNFNAPGIIEIPVEAFSEIIANAIVHRNYYINAPVQIYLFNDRLEINSPGSLPNTITAENIKYGVHVERNPTILSFLQKDVEFSYSGRGSGIPRVIKACRQAKVPVKFVDDKNRQLFSVIFYRPKSR